MLGSTTRFYVKVSSTFVEVPAIRSVEGPERTRTAVEAGVLTDTYMPYEAGQPTLGVCTVTVKYTTYAEYKELADFFASGVQEFRVQRPDGSQLDFDGVVTGVSPGSLERDGLHVFTVTIQGSEAPTDTAPA
jgi:hypothetical protein